MRRIFQVIFLEQKDVTDEIFGMCCRIGKPLLPVVKATSLNLYRFAKKVYREFPGKL